MVGKPTCTPRLSRRALLGAGAAGVTATTAGCLGGGSASFDAWTPPPETWPLARYDPRNRNHNPNAAPPRDGVETAWESQTDVDVWTLVVANGRVVAAGDEGLAVLDDDRGTIDERDPVPAQAAGFGPRDEYGRRPLYAATVLGYRVDTAIAALRDRRYGGAGGSTTFWRTYETAGGEAIHLVTGADGVYVGHMGGPLVAAAADDGSERWRKRGAVPALTDGRLLAGEYSALRAYEPRSGLDARLTGGPAETWRQRGGHEAPVISDGRVFAGRRAGMGSEEPSLFGHDAATGERLWEPRSLGTSASSPAVVGDTGYVGVSRENDDGITQSGALVALDLTDGTTRWRRDWSAGVGDPVAGGNGVVVAQGGQPDTEADRLRAYDAESGEPLWTHDAPDPIDAVALVQSTVFVGSRDGRVAALR
ncbi:MAG: PQQ-binding-like beta-propeller repeat protein [Halobacteriaceae archaeon]